ncbi:MAG: hypothetical protein ACP5G1_00790 [Nanopusillaceae archaeon]
MKKFFIILFILLILIFIAYFFYSATRPVKIIASTNYTKYINVENNTECINKYNYNVELSETNITYKVLISPVKNNLSIGMENGQEYYFNGGINLFITSCDLLNITVIPLNNTEYYINTTGLVKLTENVYQENITVRIK